jgi:hypothetical protein
MSKALHVKPALYAFIYEDLKSIAMDHGYNLLLHGSMNRDLDLVAVPWAETLKPSEEMIAAFVQRIGGHVLEEATKKTHHGRTWYVINLNRGGTQSDDRYIPDPQYYLDISVMSPGL